MSNNTTLQPMTTDELVNWCMERIEEGRTQQNIYIGDKWRDRHSEHRVTFANGDEYNVISDRTGIYTYDNKHYINGELIHRSICKYENFGYTEVEVLV